MSVKGFSETLGEFTDGSRIAYHIVERVNSMVPGLVASIVKSALGSDDAMQSITGGEHAPVTCIHAGRRKAADSCRVPAFWATIASCDVFPMSDICKKVSMSPSKIRSLLSYRCVTRAERRRVCVDCYELAANDWEMLVLYAALAGVSIKEAYSQVGMESRYGDFECGMARASAIADEFKAGGAW